jgi:carbon monoxide dehydrogenase subunit G
MKVREEFHVAKPVGDVWSFFEQPERVAACLPGVEDVTVLDPDNVQVRATQSLGPMKATFDTRVKIVERVPRELIRFTATGRTVKGALGNVRASNSVQLEPAGGSTRVIVEGDITLAGALGSVGQKVISRQAGKVTAEFARNLDIVLNGGRIEATAKAPAGLTGTPAEECSPAAAPPPAAALPAPPGFAVPVVPVSQGFGGQPAPVDPWSRTAAALSAVSALVSIVVLVVTVWGHR